MHALLTVAIACELNQFKNLKSKQVRGESAKEHSDNHLEQGWIRPAVAVPTPTVLRHRCRTANLSIVISESSDSGLVSPFLSICPSISIGDTLLHIHSPLLALFVPLFACLSTNASTTRSPPSHSPTKCLPLIRSRLKIMRNALANGHFL